MNYTYANFYELTYLSKEEWINFMLEKYDLIDILDAKEYIEISYNEVTGSLCISTYDGYDNFINEYAYKVEYDELTQFQLEEVYLHFCEQVYDTDFTNTLTSSFSCSEKDVYTKHSNVLVELMNQLAQSYGDERVKVCKTYTEANNLPLKSCVRMYLKYHNDWSQEDKQKTIERYKPYIDTTDLEAKFLS